MENNPLMSALVQGTNLNDVVAKAEDIQSGSGVDWASKFFEPQPNCDYLIKFLPNLSGDPITHRSQYRNLPDPDRKGKTFRWTSSGSAQTDPVLQLFFDLHAEMKNGDKIAEMKIQKYLKTPIKLRASCRFSNHRTKKKSVNSVSSRSRLTEKTLR